MIYVVTKENKLFENPNYKIISVEESLQLLNDCKVLQYDSETSGIDPHLCDILCIQFGNKDKDFQIVVDCSTIDILNYKEILESKFIIGQNLKFDLQFLYNYNIIPRRIYDTMIVEQLLYLGYPRGTISYSLAAIAHRRLNIDIDKSIRGQIIWRGLDTEVVLYAANDVKWLEDIMHSQIKDCREKKCLVGAKLECDFIPAISYLEWCGIMLDESKWKSKMAKDKESLLLAESALNTFVTSNPKLEAFTYINKQGDLFSGFNINPVCTINWSSSRQVVQVAKILGFDTKVQDKKTGEDKDSVIEKHLKTQKGINDEFLDLYFKYQEYAKVVSSFGQGHLDSINPKTGRLHTIFRQLETSSGRISCGSSQSNKDLCKFKKLPKGSCLYPNLQQLPSDHDTRSCFVAPKDYLMVSIDFSAEESRLGADIYKDEEMLKEFLEGSGDMHSLFAWMVFRDECSKLGCTCVADVKSKAPQWRKAVKAVEFAWMFGAAAPTIAQSANCTLEEAEKYICNLEKGFSGVSKFASEGSKFVRKNGYILICPYTGHKKYWWDHEVWLERQKSFTSEFWEEYRSKHKGTGDNVAKQVRGHFQAAAKYDRDARNVVTQGTGAIIMKDAMTDLFNWIVDNSYFNIIHICCSVHDELVCDYPNHIKEFPNILKDIMETSASKYCKSLPIPAEASVGEYWIH